MFSCRGLSFRMAEIREILAKHIHKHKFLNHKARITQLSAIPPLCFTFLGRLCGVGCCKRVQAVDSSIYAIINQGLKAARAPVSTVGEGLGSHLLVLIRCVTQVQWSLATPEEPICRRVPLAQEFLAISFVTEAGLATFSFSSFISLSTCSSIFYPVTSVSMFPSLYLIMLTNHSSIPFLFLCWELNSLDPQAAAGNPTVAVRKVYSQSMKSKMHNKPKNTSGLGVATVAKQEREEKALEAPGEQNDTTAKITRNL